MSLGFSEFQDRVREFGGVWKSQNVYFAQTRDVYCASYLPDYPEKNERYAMLYYDWLKDAWSYEGRERYNVFDKKTFARDEVDNALDIEVKMWGGFGEDDYLEGWVWVNGERFPFAFNMKTGETKVHCYSEPGWFTGARYEKPLPPLVNDNLGEIVERIGEAVEEYLEWLGISLTEMLEMAVERSGQTGSGEITNDELQITN